MLRSITIASAGMLAIGMLALAAPMGANAATRATVATASRPGASEPFAAQVRHAGLTSAQAAVLQTRVNGYLAKYREGHIGAWQIAANEIRFKGGDLLLTLPGEKHVRTLIPPSKAGGPARINSGVPIYNCPYYELCAFHLAGYTGDMITAYQCGVDVFIPWPGPAAGNFPWGSWVNNQTLGTVGLFLYGSGAEQGSTGPATSTHYYQDWTYVAYMDPC